MSWSKKLNDKFGTNLSQELCDWFDTKMWESEFVGSYAQFIPPNDLLNHKSYAIWGGLMLPDMLPLASNGGGDVLAVRIGVSGEAGEVIQWIHEGGYWSPWGASLSEALLFNLAKALDDESEEEEILEEAKRPVFEWMLTWLGKGGFDVGSLRSQLQKGRALAAALHLGLCRVAINAYLAERHLRTGLEKKVRRIGIFSIAEETGLDVEEISSWCRQPQTIPDKHRVTLAKHLGLSVDELVSINMPGALDCAKSVIALRTDLAWPYAVLGRDARERGDEAAEAKHLAMELRAPETTYDFAQTWNEFMVQKSERFSRLFPLLVGLDDFEYLEMKDSCEPRPYWIKMANEAEKEGDHAAAYGHWFLAGWDILRSDGMDAIMDGLYRTAKAAGFDALARLVEHHKKTLVQ